MRLSAATLVTAAAAVSARAVTKDCPTVPIKGPFYLSAVLKDGSAGPYHTDLDYASRGIPYLKPTKADSKQQFVWNEEKQRVFLADSPTSTYSGLIDEGSGFYFTWDGSGPESGTWHVQQSLVDCAVYVVKEGTAANESIYQWEASSVDIEYPYLHFYGSGNEKSNAAIRIDVNQI